MVQRFYAWSPDGLRLVYVTGRYLGHYKDHSRTGTWIWNASDKSRTRISTGGYYVSWPMFDGNVYLWDPNGERPSRVRRYDVKRQQLDVTSHKSIYFSASGSYYYHPGGGLLIPENVFLTTSDVGMDRASRALAMLAGWRPLAWAPDRDLVLIDENLSSTVSPGGASGVAVFDPIADTLSLLSTEGEVIWWSDTADYLLVRIAGRIERMELAAMLRQAAP